ncbi:MAG: hypothetical protein H6553_09045 [Chitinophagales bacterium]|nr:hypothetical protein [Chitinophagales bacterium]
MKKLNLLLITLVLTSSIASAQFGNFGQKLKDKMTKSQSNQQQNDDDSENKTEDETMNQYSTWVQQMQQSQQNVKYDKSYSFNLYTKIKTTTTHKNKTSTTTMELYSAENATMMKAQEKGTENMNIIMDNKNQSMITIDEAKKEGYAISTTAMDDLMQQFASKSNNQQTTEQPEVKITKTGNTKMIAGYKCEEYHIVSTDKEDKFEGNIWITNDASINFFNIFSGLGKAFQSQCKNIKSNVSGAVLEMDGKDSKTGDTYNMTVLELSKKTTTKNLSSYKIQTGFGTND